MSETQGGASNPAGQPQITLLIDGGCPLCRREMTVLRRLDRGRGRLALQDITAPDFDPEQLGLTRQEVNDRIHGVLPDGTVLTGMDVFRRAYAAVGLGWLLAPTRWPLLRQLFDTAYRWFARHRTRLTRRRPACDAGHCEV